MALSFILSSGWALVAEGFMSAFYHVCPNDTNFQFGMCVVCVWCVCVCSVFVCVVCV